jgi:hypothetical protein
LVLLDAQVERLGPLHDDGLVSDKTLAEAKQAAEQARAERQLAERTATSFQSSGAELQHATLVAARAAAEAAEQESERMLAEVTSPRPATADRRAGGAAGPEDRAGSGVRRAGGPRGQSRRGSGLDERHRPAAEAGARAAWDDAQGMHHTGTLRPPRRRSTAQPG